MAMAWPWRRASRSSRNSLTSAVNGKMNQIDQKVDEATASVPNTIREMSSQVFYVDSDNGVDDPNRSGSQGESFKTVLYAASRAAPNGLITIRLGGNADHVCEVPENLKHHNHFHGKTFLIRGDGNKWNTQNPSRLLCRATKWSSNNNVARCNFFEGSILNIAFYELEIVTQNNTGLPRYGHDSANGSDFGGIFSRGTVSGGYSAVSIHLNKANLKMSGDLMLFTGYSGSLGIFTNLFNIEGDASVPIPIISRGFALSLRLGGLTASGFSATTMPEILGYDSTKSAQSLVV